MSIRITCPSCQTSYPVDEGLRGKRVLCIHCKKAMMVPAAAVKPAPPKEQVQPAKARPAPPPVVMAADAAPVKRQPAPAKGGVSPLVWVGVALAVLVLVGGAAVLVVGGLLLAGGTMVYSSSDAAKVSKTDLPQDQGPGDADATKVVKQKKPAPGPNGQLAEEVLAKVKAATVYMRVTLSDNRMASGSGFFALEPGLVLTNAHVVGMLKPDQEPPRSVEVVLNSGEANERAFLGEILGVDRDADLAVVRIAGGNLPTPLEVQPSAGLRETQPVYVFGFPFGEKLGKSITVSQTSVSSLRKGPTGELNQVQVNGGMHPGNSGGPVVNQDGDVVGVAVAGIVGTQINFAVPGESVHAIMHGRITTLGMSHTFKEGAGTKARFHVEMLDPLKKAKQVTLHWWVGNGGPAREGLNGPAPQAGGDALRQQQPMSVQGGLATADLPVPALGGGQVVWIQAALLNGAGQTTWSAAVPCLPYEPLGSEEVALLLKPALGPRFVFLDSTNILHISEPGKKDKKYDTFMQNRMVETTAATKLDKMLLLLHYRKYTVSIPNELLDKGAGRASFNNAMNNAAKLTAVLAVDNRNRIEMNEADVSKVAPAAQKDLLNLHGQIQDSLEILSLPLPGKVVRPGMQWKAARPLMLFTGDRGDLAPMMVTYTFQGTQVRHGRTEAVIAIDAVASGTLGQSLTATGRLTGKAYFDVAASQITLAEVTAKVDLEKEGQGKLSASLVSKLERHMGHEIFVKAGRLTTQSYKSKLDCYAEDHEVQLEEGKTYHIGLECLKGKGGPQFEPRVMVADLQTKIMTGRDAKDVGPATVYDFVPRNTGKHAIRVTTQTPGQTGDYLVVVRRLDGSPKY